MNANTLGAASVIAGDVAPPSRQISLFAAEIFTATRGMGELRLAALLKIKACRCWKSTSGHAIDRPRR